MFEVRRVSSAAPEAVWAVLADPRTFPAWVVGAARVDRVDGTWPAAGSGLAYRVGAWPVLPAARTVVVAAAAGRELALHGDLGRLGAVDLVLSLRPADGGCELALREDVGAGPATWLPRPVRGAVITARNAEALRRLALLAEQPSRVAARRA